MARKSNASYWAQRIKNMEDALKDQSFVYVQNLESQFTAAQVEIEKQIAVWYQRFADNNGVSLVDAKRLLTKNELAEFQWAVGEYIAYGQQNALDGAWMKQLENASARVHISRLEMLKLQIQQQAEVLYSNQLDFVDEAARQIYTGSYYHTAFEIQRGLGVGWTMHAINEETITKVLSRPWTVDNQTFRDRCWTNKQSLVTAVNTQLTQMIIRGEAPDRAITAISKQFGVARTKAGRLVMTESAYFASAAQKDCFDALGVERYTIVSSFDHDTCELCAAMDGKVFKMSEYQVGLTAPPFHPWCRCCTCPHFEDMAGIGERWTRSTDGKTHKIPRDMTFEQWQRRQVVQNPSGLKIEKKQKHAILDEKDIYAINEYKSAKSYRINAALRGEAPMTDELQAAIDSIDRAIEKLPAYTGTVRRSITEFGIDDMDAFWDEHAPGNKLRFKAYTSSGTEVYDESFPIQYVIQSKTGRDMREYNPSELEVLFRRETEFAVTRVEGNTIFMEEVE